MQICFFEDDACTNFLPLTLTRPVDNLRLGILTIAEKWCHALGNVRWSRVVRPDLKNVFDHADIDRAQPSYWINSRFLPSASLLNSIENLDVGTCIKNGKTVVAAHADATTTNAWLHNERPDFRSMLVFEGQPFDSIARLWDLFLMNAAEIINDLERLDHSSSNNNSISDHAILVNKAHTFIGEGAIIEPGVILMADKGPIYIGKNATIMAGAIIKGPVAICEDTTVKMDAKIYPGTTIGPACKVGGEINNSIFHSFSNKGHDGFLGNSLIGQWCNLGADTNTSNLKNNYSTIRITDWKSRKSTETGQQFLGTVMGDHTKTAINTQLNTGTMCGVSCNIFAADFPPKYIPSFSWVGSNVIQSYKIKKALETMQAMMTRRGVDLTADYEQMMRQIFKHSQRAAP